MPHRALITGVAGFAGSFLAEHLLARGDAVLGCSQDGRWMPSSPAQLAGRVELVAWDVGDPAGLVSEARRRIEQFRPDWIFHLAALSHPNDCGAHEPTAAAMAINVEGTRRVMELAASLSSRPRVLLTSSSHVYSPVSPQSPKIDETAPTGPQNGYGRTKLSAEEAVRLAVRELGCDAVIARSFLHTGPRQMPPMMLPQWAEQFVVGSAPVQVHTRDAWIDLSDGRDTVRAYRLLMERGHRGEVYNIGSGIARRSGDVLDMLLALADPRRPIVETHPGLKQDPIADTARLVACTGWRPEIPLEKTVADTLAWWRQYLPRA